MTSTFGSVDNTGASDGIGQTSKVIALNGNSTDHYEAETERVIVGHKPEVMQLLEEFMSAGIYSAHSIESSAKLFGKVESWRSAGDHIGFVAGVFDTTHENHRWYLIEARLNLAIDYAERQGIIWEELSKTQKIETFMSKNLKLIVTIDDDIHVSNGKGKSRFKPGVRPVMPWNDRAKAIKTLSMSLDDSYSLQVVNAVTMHSGQLKGLHSSDVELAKAIRPNMWFVATESVKTAINAEHAIRENTMETRLFIMPNHVYEINPLTGRPYSTSDIVQRIIDGTSI